MQVYGKSHHTSGQWFPHSLTEKIKLTLHSSAAVVYFAFVFAL